MPAAPQPANDEDRVADLRDTGILDTGEDERFDRLTRCAALLLDVPLTLISLVDDSRQTFKSICGCAPPGTPRDQALCAHVVHEDRTLVIEDTRADPRTADLPLVTADPGWRFYAGAPIRSGNGFVLGTLCAVDHRPRKVDPGRIAALEDMAGTAADLIEQERMARKASLDRQILGEAIEAMQDGFVLYDRSDRLVVANGRMRGFYPELSHVLCRGATMRDVYSEGMRLGSFPRHTARGEAWVEERIETREAGDYKSEEPLRDGRTLLIKQRIMESGDRIVTASDVTEVKAQQNLLRELNDVLEMRSAELEERVAERTRRLEQSLEREKEINELQRKFVSMVSHEFRTPMTIIDGLAHRMSRKLKQRGVSELDDHLRRIRAAVSRLTTLIEGVLSTARIQDGQLTIEAEPTDIAAQIWDVVCEQGDMNPEFQIEADLSGLPVMSVDPRYFYQVVTNLMSNAIKYSGEGRRIEVTGRCAGETVEIAIRDFGIGVAADEIDRISRRFFRASSAKGIQGTGLGLALCRTIAQLHDGELRFESELGKGTTVTLVLPAGRIIGEAGRRSA